MLSKKSTIEAKSSKDNKTLVLFIVVGIFAYFFSLFGSFVWDDISQIQSNDLVHSLSNIPKLFTGGTYAPQAGGGGSGTYYRPLMSLTFTLVYSIVGAKPFLFHLVQIIIHITNSYLIFILFRKFFKKPIALFLSLVFLVHPMNVEAVSYVSSLGEPLFVLFGLIALLLFLRKASIKNLLLVSIFLLLAMLAKETGVVFIVVIVSYYFLIKSRGHKLFDTLITSLVPLGLYLLLRFPIAKVQVLKIPDVPMMTAPFKARIFSMPAMFLFYLETFFFPKDLYIMQQWSILKPVGLFYLTAFLLLLTLVFLAVLGYWLNRKKKKSLSRYIFFIIWLLVGIGAHLQIIPLDFTVADRYFYFGMIGLLGIIGACLDNVKVSHSKIKSSGILIATLIIILLTVRTLYRASDWVSGLILYEHDFKYEKSDRIENLLAVELVNAQRYDEAGEHFKSLLSKNPDQTPLYVNLAVTYEWEGKLKEAEQVYKDGLKIDDMGVVYYNYARMLLQREGKYQEAKDICEEGISKFPNNADLWLIEAVADYKLGNKQNALKEIEKSKGLLPNPNTLKIYDAIVNDKQL